MWIILKEEIYKIKSRKIIWLSLCLLLAFSTLRLYNELHYYTTFVDGKTYHGMDALRKDQALTGRYAGLLTKDKVSQIYKEYGFFY